VQELVRQQAQVVVATGVVTHLAKARNNGAPKRADTPVVAVGQAGPHKPSVLLRTPKVQKRVTEKLRCMHLRVVRLAHLQISMHTVNKLRCC
jgi:hypothetical protein